MQTKTRLRVRLSGLASLLFCMAGSSPRATAQGSVIDLNTSLKVPGNALAIGQGTAAGFSGNSPFLYSNGNLYLLGLPQGYVSGVATGLSDSPNLAAVGSITDTSGNTRAMLWYPYGNTILDTLGGNHAWAYGINSWHQIVGVSELPASGGKTTTHGFVWDSANGTVDLTPGQGNSAANAINAWGDIAGAVTVGAATHAAFWDSAGFHDLGTLGGPTSVATAISDGDVVVGWSLKTTSASSQTGFRWDALYGATVLSPLPGDVSSVATTTSEVFCAGYSVDSKGNHRAVAWNVDSDYVDGSILDLNTLLAPKSGWTLQEVHGIAPDGSGGVAGLVGLGTLNGQKRAILLVGRHLDHLGNGSYVLPGGTTGLIPVYTADLQGASVDLNNGIFPLPVNVTCTNKAATAARTGTTYIHLTTSPVTVNTTGTVTATCCGVSVSIPVTVRPIGVGYLYFTGGPFKGGTTITGTVQLEAAAAPGPITVSFKSDHPNIIPAPASVTIPKGSGRVTVMFKTNKPPVSPTIVTLTATANGISVTTPIPVQ